MGNQCEYVSRTPVGIPCPEAVMVCASICLKASLFFFGGAFSLLPMVPWGGTPGWPPTTITLKDKHEIHAEKKEEKKHTRKVPTMTEGHRVCTV